MIRRAAFLCSLCLAVPGFVSACGEGDDGAFVTLPPIETTTTTTTTTTTISTERLFYTIQPGDSLRIIAERAGVTVQSIVELNDNIENADNIQAGQIIEIPTGIQLLTELPNRASDD